MFLSEALGSFTLQTNKEIVDLFKGSVSLEVRANDEDVGRYLERSYRAADTLVPCNQRLQERIKTRISGAVVIRLSHVNISCCSLQ
jgi:hypothetical protein